MYVLHRRVESLTGSSPRLGDNQTKTLLSSVFQNIHWCL